MSMNSESFNSVSMNGRARGGSIAALRVYSPMTAFVPYEDTTCALMPESFLAIVPGEVEEVREE